MIKKTILITTFYLALCCSLQASNMMPTPLQDQLKFNLQLAEVDQTNFDIDEEQNKTSSKPNLTGKKKVSVAKTALYSALLPGLGEYKLGHKTKAKIFFSAETVGWLSFAAFKVYGNWKEDDMISFASERANANLSGKNDLYLDMVGFYSNLDEYNALGRVSDRDREFYPNTPEYHWQWTSIDDQQAYRDLKNSMRSADKKSDFVITLLIVNRIVSVIDAVRDAVRFNRNSEDYFGESKKKSKVKFAINPFSKTNQIKLTIAAPF